MIDVTSSKEAYMLYVKSKNFAYLRIDESNESYFENNFCGKKILATWEPPKLEQIDTHKPLNDFMGFDLTAPAVSERAKDALVSEVKNGEVEFLPLTTIGCEQYYVLNVTKFINCLNKEKSKIRYSSDNSGKIVRISKYVLDENICTDSFIFKLPESPSGDIFVTRKFIEVIVKHNLSGVGLVDPASPMSQFSKPEWDGTICDLSRI